MPENLSKTPKMNQLILDAALSKEPVFDAFKRLCNTPGYRKMDYVDFEWKYYQYYHGNRDSTIERSPENSSELTFSGLPIDVLEKVAEPLALSERFRLRRVSRGLRDLVDSTDGYCQQLELFRFYSIAFEDFQIKDHVVELWSCRSHEEYMITQNRRDAMMTNVFAMLNNPRLKFGLLRIGACAKRLKPLGFQLDVRSIDIRADEKQFRSILEFVKPGCLEEIKFSTSLSAGYQLTPDQWTEITETEQWKQAKKLKLRGVPQEFSIFILRDKILHFKEINVKYFKFTDENLTQIRDFLLKSDHLESCRLERWDMFSSCAETALESVLNQDPLYNPQSRRFSIPNSNDSFQLEFGRDGDGKFNKLTITKTSKT